MKATFPPRPTYSGPPVSEDPAAFEAFREEERVWFDKLVMHPHVRLVMHIPPEEPIFVLRAQDTYGPETIRYWITLMVKGTNFITKQARRGAILQAMAPKLRAADDDMHSMLEWQVKNRAIVKVPD